MAAAIRPLARSVNPQEIAFFSKLSAQWWNENGEFGLLHRMNPVRTQFITQKLDVKGLDVLDVGCGGGLLSESLARLGANTLGIDASESNIRIAQHHASTDASALHTLTYAHTPAEHLLTSSPKRYDAVCSMEVIEHVDDPASFLHTLTQLVKPGGHLFLSTIARTPLAYLLTIFAAEKVLRKVQPGTHTYDKFINPKEMVEFFQNLREPDASPSAAGSVTGSSTGGTGGGGVPWIPKHPVSKDYDLRGIIYLPWENRWTLLNRSASQYGGTECNYVFWVRKPPALQGAHVPGS